ncbi:MAG: FtsX-like permease family protein, partial [Solirubrobacteraceae bacterium]
MSVPESTETRGLSREQGARGTAGGLLIRGVRWRLGASLLTVLTAAIAVATAALGPLYLRAAGDSVVRQTVAQAAVQDRGLTLSPGPNLVHPLTVIQRAERIAQSTGGPGYLYGAAITTVSSGITLPDGDKSQLFWRTGICRVLRFVQGGCDLGFGDVVMTSRGARAIGASVGQIVDVRVVGRRTPLRLRLGGIALTPDLTLPYWWGDGVEDFPAGRSFGAGSAATDPLIASPATVLDVPGADVPVASGQLPLRAGTVGLGNEGAVRGVISRTIATVGAQGVNASTPLLSLLSAADVQRHAMATIVAVAAIQLVLLAVWVLGSVLLRGADARRSETRVARLRGFPALSMLWVTAGEPALLCAVGVAIGVAAAWVAIVVVGARHFVPGTVITFDGWTFAALALTIAAIAGTLAAGTLRSLRFGDWAQRPAQARHGPVSPSRVLDAVLVVLAIVALVALATTGALNGHADPLASAAPGLIALGAAVLAVQLILLACGLGIRATADSGWIGSFLALRQSARRPGVLRQARVLVIALCLACFAAAASSVANANRATTAQFEVGAETVVTVAPTGPATLKDAVRRADPQGRFAMAAIDLSTPSTRLLAVDSSRLAAVASWPGGISARGLRDVARAIDPPTMPAVSLPEAPLYVAARAALATGTDDVDLGAWVSNGGGGTAIVDLGALHAGERTYSADLRGVCPGGCQLAGLGLLPAPGGGSSVAGPVTLSVTRVWSAVGGA